MPSEPRLLDQDGGGLPLILRALSLSLGAAIALGIARFSYALLLPPMKADLHWTFAQAGALNTSLGVGYLVGALAYPLIARRVSAERLFLGGCVLTSVCMAVPGVFYAFGALSMQRAACGLFSAVVFVSGGILASRLATVHANRSGLVLGLFYGGAGLGITLSALVVPTTLGSGGHGWQASWVALGLICALCTALAWPVAANLPAQARTQPAVTTDDAPPPMARYAPLMAAYGLFGVGYIGYMTFVIALLRGSGLSSSVVTAFFVVLGLATTVSGRLWAGTLHRARGGGAFALFCCLLAMATLVPAVTGSPVAAFASGVVFGSTFLSVVASTTAFVRHNLPAARWSAGISAFTVVFAAGQIVGPVVLGAISDGVGLSRGFVFSAGILLVAGLLASGQRPLASRARQDNAG